MRFFIISILFGFFVLAGMAHEAKADEPEFIIGFPEDNLSNDWRAAQMEEIKTELAKYPNIKFLMADAQGDVAQNITHIEEMAAQGAQLLFLAPRKPDAVNMVVKRLRSQGMHIVLLTRKLNNANYDTFISPDDFKIGYEAALFLAEHLKGRGHVLMLEGVPTTTTAIQRKSGFLSGLVNYPDVKVVSRVANYSRAEAVIVTGKALIDGLKIDAIYAHNDAMAAGARVALKANGIDPKSMPTVSIDYLQETKVAILKGEQLASFVYPTCGKLGVAAAIDILHGKNVPRYISVPFKLVTRENVEKIKPTF